MLSSLLPGGPLTEGQAGRILSQAVFLEDRQTVRRCPLPLQCSSLAGGGAERTKLSPEKEYKERIVGYID